MEKKRDPVQVQNNAECAPEKRIAYLQYTSNCQVMHVYRLIKGF